jgi:hypothetical protein
VVGKLRDGLCDYGLWCGPGCRTFAEPQLAHAIASVAAERAGLAIGSPLTYRAFGEGSGQVEGAVLALAGGRQP